MDAGIRINRNLHIGLSVNLDNGDIDVTATFITDEGVEQVMQGVVEWDS